uniref:superoxide dismutase n=1 Tax=Romanomermis culicivorax TaxID=13658 RepID=A0A915KPV2_ROMCU
MYSIRSNKLHFPFNPFHCRIFLRLKHTLPDLPYDYNALEPVISADIMKLHHQKHHQAYVTNLNQAEEKMHEALAKNCVNSIVSLEPALRFNGGGHLNHSIFWTNLAPKSGGQPSGHLLEAINKHFGSFEKFKGQLSSSAVGVQGSGWAWLGYNPNNKSLQIATCMNQDPLFPTTGLTPLLGIDVWEHAYYLQYKNVRAEYKMIKSTPICQDHKDLIHDIAYDFYGRRIATCSSDHTVKVWDLNENDQWILTASWKVHSGSVWKIDWAHPEYGQLLATCSFDRTAIIWEEISDYQILSEASSGGAKSQKHWVKRCSLVDSRANVTDVKFAPRHLGLMMAICSQDGVLRIYEASDIMNVTQWSLQHEITCQKFRCSCLAWNPSLKWIKVEPQSFFTDPVYDLEFANNIGRSYHLLAVASKNVHIFQLKSSSSTTRDATDPTTKFEVRQVALFDDHESQVWRVSWNITGTILASSGADGTVRLYKGKFSKCLEFSNIVRFLLNACK